MLSSSTGAARAHRSRQPTRIGRATNPRRAERPAVLVVDDDIDARRMYAEYLRAQGCAVFCAADGESAVEKCRALMPDVVVLDLAMPRVDGWTALRMLRESSWTDRVAVVVVSAVPDSRDGSLQAGGDAHLAKPCMPHVLWLQVQALLRLRNA